MAKQEQKKPNILIMWGDDIGMWNVSRYSQGMMGYRTPNIDRIGEEGVTFTDCYAQQSCTAGRAAFITGQSPMRTGLLKVGLPAAKEGLSEKGPDDCRPTQAAGLRDGTVWQEPPRRPQRVPAQGLPDTKVGAFTPALYDEAKRNGWTVISMKNDWRRIFAFEQ